MRRGTGYKVGNANVGNGKRWEWRADNGGGEGAGSAWEADNGRRGGREWDADNYGRGVGAGNGRQIMAGGRGQ